MQHPNLFDRFFVKIYPRYLFPGQTSQILARINVSVLHKLPQSKSAWNLTDTVCLEAGSKLIFLGLAKSLHLRKVINSNYSIFEIVSPRLKDSASHPLNPGDVICVTPFDRQYVYPLTNSLVLPGVQKSQPAV